MPNTKSPIPSSIIYSHMKSLLFYIVCLVHVLALPALASDVEYVVRAYGGKNAVVILSGSVRNNLTTNLSSDGQSVRVSGVDINFVQAKDSYIAGLVSEIFQVKRGAFSDLIINLKEKCELTPTPGNKDLKLFLKAKANDVVLPSVKDNTTSTKPQQKSVRGIPINITVDTPAARQAKPLFTQINLVFPNTQGLKSITSLSQELKMLAYSLDIIWSWLTGQPLQFITTEQAPPTTPQKGDEVEELEKLVQDLTQELVDVRKELMLKKE